MLLLACSSGTGADPKSTARDAATEAPPSAVDAGGDDAVLGDDGGPTYAATYTAIYDEILSQTCALAFCHAGSLDYLVITSKEDGYANLVDAQAMGPQCASTGLKRVEPGDPDKSLMYLKITNPPCGLQMPPVGGMLQPAQIAQIKAWIEAGAPNN